MIRRRLRPSRLPHPIKDGFLEGWWGGIGIGAILMLAIGVMAVKGAF